jgi:chitinase
MEVDGTRGCLRSFAALKLLPENAHVKVILSVGGGGPGSRNFPIVASEPPSLSRFVASARTMVDNYGLDGIDSKLPPHPPIPHTPPHQSNPHLPPSLSLPSTVDWEHPTSPAEGAAYLTLLGALRAALPRPRYQLTSALPAGIWALRNIALPQASSLLDLVNLMCYDLAGPWTPLSGHHAALFPSPLSAAGDPAEATPTAHAAIAYALARGLESRKILLGVPVYGRSFLGAAGPARRYEGSGGEDGVFEYALLPRPGTVERVDREACAAYCVGGDGGFVSYDNPVTVALKARYVQRMRMAGLFYWTATGDAKGERSLVYAGYSALHDTS